MYLKSISLDIDYPTNAFISHIEFSMNNYYCDTFKIDNAELIRKKLHDIGFEFDNTYLVELKEEDED